MLSTGVSTRRVLRPVLAGAVFMIGVSVLNQELLVPSIAHRLAMRRDDPEGEKRVVVEGAHDANGVHVEGVQAVRKDLKVAWFYVTTPETPSSPMIHLTAQEAHYLPPDAPGELRGGWLLVNASPPTVESPHPDLRPLDEGKYFLRTTDVTFDTVTRQRAWFIYHSTPQLRDLLERPESRRLGAVAVLFHMRLTRPLVGLLLVLMGLGIILRDQNRHVFISTGLCLVTAAVFFAAVFGCKYLGENDYLAPALAAWLPVLAFTPVAVTMFDAVHT
jgi:lipopolysaccharide export system permease protein